MAVGIGPVDAPAAVVVVDRPRLLAPGVGEVLEPALPDAGEDLVELLVDTRKA